MAVAIFKTHGTVGFTQQGTKCRITYSLKNLTPKCKHGFHIHENPFQNDDCNEAGSHYNPKKKEHGDLDSDQRHDGDLGNIKADTYGESAGNMCAKLNLEDIIGRTIVLHAEEDDLGKNDGESKTTGNAGARIDCAIIKRKGELKY
tara:strand:- start:4588 stop:5025 length:438 start_codon:yes stop_codon:yes gene_type:complete